MKGINITNWDEAKVRDYITRANATTGKLNEAARLTGKPWIDVLRECSDEAEIIVGVWAAPLTRWGVEVGFVKGAPLLEQERARAEVTGAKTVALRTMYVYLENRTFAMAYASMMGDDRDQYPGLQEEVDAALRVH